MPSPSTNPVGGHRGRVHHTDPQAEKAEEPPKQGELLFDDGKGLGTEDQRYDHTAVINAVRQEVGGWRQDPDLSRWRVTPENARLLQQWRHHPFAGSIGTSASDSVRVGYPGVSQELAGRGRPATTTSRYLTAGGFSESCFVSISPGFS